jgi:hypothetical protein
MRRVDEFLRTIAPEDAKKERTNLRFHLATYVGAFNSGAIYMSTSVFDDGFNIEEITDEYLQSCCKEVWQVFSIIKRQTKLTGDRIAKNRDFDQRVLERVKTVLQEWADAGNQ